MRRESTGLAPGKAGAPGVRLGSSPDGGCPGAWMRFHLDQPTRERLGAVSRTVKVAREHRDRSVRVSRSAIGRALRRLEPRPGAARRARRVARHADRGLKPRAKSPIPSRQRANPPNPGPSCLRDTHDGGGTSLALSCLQRGRGSCVPPSKPAISKRGLRPRYQDAARSVPILERSGAPKFFLEALGDLRPTRAAGAAAPSPSRSRDPWCTSRAARWVPPGPRPYRAARRCAPWPAPRCRSAPPLSRAR